MAAGGATGRPGAIHLGAQPVYQPAGGFGPPQRGARHHDRQPARSRRGVAGSQGTAIGRAAAAGVTAAGLHRGRRSGLLLRLRPGVPREGGNQQAGRRPQGLPDQDDPGPCGAVQRQECDQRGGQPGLGQRRQRHDRHPPRQGFPQGPGDRGQPRIRPEAGGRPDGPAAALLPGRRRGGIGVQDLHQRRSPEHGHGHQCLAGRAAVLCRPRTRRQRHPRLPAQDLVCQERRRLPQSVKHDRRFGVVTQHRLRQTYSAGGRRPHRGHGGATGPTFLRRSPHRTGLRAQERRKPRRLHQTREHRLVHAGAVRGQCPRIVKRCGHSGLRGRVVPTEPDREGGRPAWQGGRDPDGRMRAGGAGGPGQHPDQCARQGHDDGHRRGGCRIGRLGVADGRQDRHHRVAPVVGLPRLYQPACRGELHLRRLPETRGVVCLSAAQVRRRRQSLRRHFTRPDLVPGDESAGHQIRSGDTATDRPALSERYAAGGGALRTGPGSG